MAAPFALTPSDAIQGTIDFTTREGKTIWQTATAPFYTRDGGYDVTAPTLISFLNELEVRGSEMGLDRLGPNYGILHVSVDPSDANAQRKYILDKYGDMNLDLIEDYEASYIGDDSREAQDNRALYYAILSSLNEDGKSIVKSFKSEHYITCDDNEKRPSALCLLKIIIREAYLDSSATTNQLMTALRELPTAMAECGNNIIKFNSQVNALIAGLRARGAEAPDITTDLLRGYKACSDKSFRQFVNRKEEQIDEESNLTYQELMQLAANKFKKSKTLGVWEAPSDEEEKIIALQAELQQLKKQRGGHQQNRRGGQRKDAAKKTKKEIPKWMTMKPSKDKMTKPLTKDGKEWHWCSTETGGKCDGIFRRHKPSECKGAAKKRGTSNDDSKVTAEKKQKKVQIKKALSAIADDGEQSE